MAIHFGEDDIGPADGQVGEIEFAHLFRTQQIAAIDNDRMAQRPSVVLSCSLRLHCQGLQGVQV
jgi:hypothetical protein